MKIFAATLMSETNTFAVVPTGLDDFKIQGIYRGTAAAEAPTGIGVFHARLKRLAEADGHEVVESLCAFAQPAGRTLGPVYESFRKQILDDLQAALPIDAVQLYLHGAMVAYGYDDCEGDLLEHVRSVVGPGAAIGVELDLHCHFTERIRRNADVVICYKEYPHTDTLERAQELYSITLSAARREVRPVIAVQDCGMVGLWHTTREPLKSLVARIRSLEGKDGVLSISIGYGFPWGDVADCGAKIWVVTDNDAERAQALAADIARQFWEMRDLSLATATPVETVVERVRAASRGPVVIADPADNPGGGAMSDSTFLLRALLDAGVSNFAIGYLWDLGAVHICRSAGVGASLNLRIGGKCGPLSGAPVDLPVTVKAMIDGHGQTGLGMDHPLGTTVWVQADNEVDIVLCTIRSQVFGPSVFAELGIDVGAKRAVVVKSAHHFYAGFAPIAADVIYAATPGTVALDFEHLPHRKRTLDYWPRVPCPETVHALLTGGHA